MAKSTSQIQAFLMNVRPLDELNRMAILGYCKTVLGFRGRFDDKTEGKAPVVSLDAFKRWLEADGFQKGDTVFHQATGTVGIVSETVFPALRLGVALRKDGILVESENFMPDECRFANMEEMTALQRKMNENGLIWNRRDGTALHKVEEPQNNQYVRICVAGHKVGLGVFKEIDGTGRLVFYCVKLEGVPIRYSMHEVVGDRLDYQVSVVRTYERNIFNEELKKAGLVWNGHMKRLEPANVRAIKGGRYYYINEYFEMDSAQENHKPRDAKRFAAGNYFLMEEHARPLLETIRSSKAKKRKGTR